VRALSHSKHPEDLSALQICCWLVSSAALCYGQVLITLKAQSTANLLTELEKV